MVCQFFFFSVKQMFESRTDIFITFWLQAVDLTIMGKGQINVACLDDVRLRDYAQSVQKKEKLLR